MNDFEVFQFWCCGKQLETDAERKVTCPECKKQYVVGLPVVLRPEIKAAHGERA